MEVVSDDDDDEGGNRIIIFYRMYRYVLDVASSCSACMCVIKRYDSRPPGGLVPA